MTHTRTYVVTGSASGIGAATTAMLRERGATVIGCDLDDAEIRADLSTPAGRRSLVDQVTERGPVDAVLAVAGGGRTGLVETNYFGTVATLEGLRPLLAQSDAPQRWRCRRPHRWRRWTSACCRRASTVTRKPRSRTSMRIRRWSEPRAPMGWPSER